MRICLDTNFIWGWFENAIKAYRKNPEEYKNRKFDITKKMKFLLEVKFDLFTTNIAKAEVYRKLFSERNAKRELCQELWSDFVDYFSLTVLEIKENDFNEIADMCLIIQLGKGMILNLVQLQFVKKRELYFITGDKKIEEFSNYYNKICSYIKLRKLLDVQQF